MKAIRHTLVVLLGLLCTAYLLNIGAGFIELIPDNIPLVGNLDEAGAAYILFQCLAYFGLNPRIGPGTQPHKNRD